MTNHIARVETGNTRDPFAAATSSISVERGRSAITGAGLPAGVARTTATLDLNTIRRPHIE
jgi:hypothetical protein